MRLYQWMPYATFKKAIGDGCIWVRATMPMEFNDPFDCTGGIWGYPNSDVVREFMEKCPASRMCFEQRFQLGMLGDDYNTAAVRGGNFIMEHVSRPSIYWARISHCMLLKGR